MTTTSVCIYVYTLKEQNIVIYWKAIPYVILSTVTHYPSKHLSLFFLLLHLILARRSRSDSLFYLLCEIYFSFFYVVFIEYFWGSYPVVLNDSLNCAWGVAFRGPCQGIEPDLLHAMLLIQHSERSLHFYNIFF